MIVVRIKGGLGNQLFQYAFGYALAKKMNDDLFLDASYYKKQSLRSFKLDKFNIEYCSMYPYKKKPFFVKLVEKKVFNKLLRLFKIGLIKLGKNIYILDCGKTIDIDFCKFANRSIYLEGYFFNQDYFLDYRDDLKRQLTQNYNVSDDYCALLNTIKQGESVAIHVRRGDFLTSKDKVHYVLSENYYMKAIDCMKKMIEKPTFFWFSDDIDWVKKTFGENEQFVFVSLCGDNADIDELMLMKECKHIVSANSTFSWWGAWLLESNYKGNIIVPNKPYGPSNMIPKEWIRIETNE